MSLTVKRNFSLVTIKGFSKFAITCGSLIIPQGMN